MRRSQCCTLNNIKASVFTCEQLSDLHICGLPEQSHQSRYSSAVLQGDLVVVVGFAIHQVPQGSAGAAVHVGHPVVQQVHQQLDATLPPDLQTEQGDGDWGDGSRKFTNDRGVSMHLCQFSPTI